MAKVRQDVAAETLEELQEFIDRGRKAGVEVVVLNPIGPGGGNVETLWTGAKDLILMFAHQEQFEDVEEFIYDTYAVDIADTLVKALLDGELSNEEADKVTAEVLRTVRYALERRV